MKLRHFKKFIALLVVCSSSQYAFAQTVNQPVAVNVVTAGVKSWQQTITSTGTLVADQGITIKSEVAGRITKIYFTSGSHVGAGQALIQIYPDILLAQEKEDRANLFLTKQTLDRYTDLFKKNAVSKSDYDKANAAYQIAEATLQSTQGQLNQALIRAPFDGYLGITQVNVGDYLSAGDRIVNLEDTDPMFVDFTVPEIYSKAIARNQKVTVNSQAYGSQEFTGTVIAIESLIDPNTRTLKIRASIPNRDNILIPGSFVVTNVYVGQPESLIDIPQTALVYSAQGDYVYVIKNNKAVKTRVTLGERGETDIFIKSGLAVGDVVVTEGQQRLQDGSPVTIEPVSAPG